jgi:hypothetical protein
MWWRLTIPTASWRAAWLKNSSESCQDYISKNARSWLEREWGAGWLARKHNWKPLREAIKSLKSKHMSLVLTALRYACGRGSLENQPPTARQLPPWGPCCLPPMWLAQGVSQGPGSQKIQVKLLHVMEHISVCRCSTITSAWGALMSALHHTTNAH